MQKDNPYESPQSGHESGTQWKGKRERSLPFAIILGTVVALVALLISTVTVGLLFAIFVFPDHLEDLPYAERHDLVLDTRYVKPAVVLLWAGGMFVGSFVGARRCAARWGFVSVGIASVYILLWGIPSVVIARGQLSATQWAQIAVLLPAAVAGGAIARRTIRQ